MRKRLAIALSGFAATIVCGMTWAATQDLKVGDAAPALKPMKWVKGSPVIQFDKGQIYIIEFWATWCSPCIANIPHLNALARQYRGKATVIGISVQEEGSLEESIKRVEKFVRKQGDKMNYLVAMDHPEQKTLVNSWIKAAGYKSIPVAFVVDRQGRIAWKAGDTSSFSNRLEEVVAHVVAGRYDLAMADAESTQRRKADEFSRKRTQLLESVGLTLQNKDYARSLAQVDAYFAAADKLAQEMLDPDMLKKIFDEDARKQLLDHEAEAFPYKLRALLHVNEGDGLAYARSSKKIEPSGAYLPGMVGSIIANEDGLSQAAYQYAIECQQESLSKLGPSSGEYAALAKAYYRTGQISDAVQAQQRAIEEHMLQKKHYKKEKLASFEKYLGRLQAQLTQYELARQRS